LLYFVFSIYRKERAKRTTVIAGAKKTGDYAVLSHPDLCVLALTYSLHQREKAKAAAAAAAAAAKSESANEARCVHESVVPRC
jgi:rRNA maturation endonuclease Nob1